MKRSIRFVICFLLVFSMAVVPLWANAAVWGDVTGEGRISAEDARLALRAAIGLESYKKGSAAFAGADIIADGKITTDDARLILRIAVGLEPSVNQYDIIRTGSFCIEGRLDASSDTPMKMAVNKELVYLEMASGDTYIGYLVKNKSIYLVSPGDKTYHKLNALETAALKSFGLLTEAELREMVDSFGFDKMPSLDQADTVTGANLDGKPCAVYIFKLSDGSKTCVYMYGYRLLAFSSVSADGKTESMMMFTDISADVPVLPPKDYRSVSLVKLMSSLPVSMEG